MSDPHEPHLLEITQDPDLLRRILDNQANDIITRQTEQEIRRREIETGHEYSLRLLDAQLADKQRDREYLKSTNTKGSIVVGFLCVLVTAVFCYALYLNKDQLVMEFLKAVLFLVTGGVGGYSLKVVRDKADSPKQ
jgi:hypothetical protein